MKYSKVKEKRDNHGLIWLIRAQESKKILTQKKLVYLSKKEKKKISSFERKHKYYSSPSINCLIAYQYRSGINGDRLLTSTGVSTTRAWEQARSILRINCINVSSAVCTTHTFQLIIEVTWIVRGENQKFPPPLRGEELGKQRVTPRILDWAIENDGSDKTRGGEQDRPCQWANSGNSAAIFLLGCQVSFNEEIK